MPDLRKQITTTARRLCLQGYTAGDETSISCRDLSDRILITPRGGSLGDIEPDRLVLLDKNGQPPEDDPRPAPSADLHLTVYGRRSDAGAVMITQPPAVMAFAVAAIPLVQPAVPETVLTIGSVPLAPYTTPYTAECAAAIERLLDDHDALLLQGRGLLTLAPNLSGAAETVERIASLAAALMGARALGHVGLLDGKHIRGLMNLRQKLHLEGRNPWAQEDRSEEKEDRHA
jgi:L-fuculose-phosphate aldolase